MIRGIIDEMRIFIRLFVWISLLATPFGALAQRTSNQQQCESVEITASLGEGQAFQQSIGFLTLKLRPLKFSGWDFALVDSKGDDFIYPVNPPLRFNGSQTLGRGYGDSARTSLGHGRELRFLLNRADYTAVESLMKDALWPADSGDPDHAADRYFAAIDKLVTGLLQLTVTRSEISPEDEIHSAQFTIELTAPVSFEFDNKLMPRRAACPQSTSPIALRH